MAFQETGTATVHRMHIRNVYLFAEYFLPFSVVAESKDWVAKSRDKKKSITEYLSVKNVIFVLLWFLFVYLVWQMPRSPFHDALPFL